MEFNVVTFYATSGTDRVAVASGTAKLFWETSTKIIC